jgi:hypothetical protein
LRRFNIWRSARRNGRAQLPWDFPDESLGPMPQGAPLQMGENICARCRGGRLAVPLIVDCHPTKGRASPAPTKRVWLRLCRAVASVVSSFGFVRSPYCLKRQISPISGPTSPGSQALQGVPPPRKIIVKSRCRSNFSPISGFPIGEGEVYIL